MPSNIFANTGTNVSVLFIDKSNQNEEALLIDASKLGTKIKVGKNQKTVLSDKELNKIVSTFIERKIEDDFSVSVSYEDIVNKNYSFSAGQYFEVKIEYVEMTEAEFKAKIDGYKKTLTDLFTDGEKLNKEIQESLDRLHYEDKRTE